jgi:hypothetical protein
MPMPNTMPRALAILFTTTTLLGAAALQPGCGAVYIENDDGGLAVRDSSVVDSSKADTAQPRVDSGTGDASVVNDATNADANAGGDATLQDANNTDASAPDASAPPPCGLGEPAALGEYATWQGKVNVHRTTGGAWSVDSDCSSGAGNNTIVYCRKFWPQTARIVTMATTPELKPFTSGGGVAPVCGTVYPLGINAAVTQYACCQAIAP